MKMIRIKKKFKESESTKRQEFVDQVEKSGGKIIRISVESLSKRHQTTVIAEIPKVIGEIDMTSLEEEVDG